MLEWIRQQLLWLDYELWFQINTVWRNALLDSIMPFIRNQYFWGPLYLFLLLFMTLNFRKTGWIWCVFFLITFAFSDYTSASILKPVFERTRPCNNPHLQDVIHLIVPRSSGLSFPSSHAANHFSLSIFMTVTLGSIHRGIWIAALAWAALISYAQVYVGVHFPMDVLFGGMLGIAFGMITGTVFNRRFRLGSGDIPR